MVETNKEKGNFALGKAISYFTENNYIVSIPLNDTQDYDLIVDEKSKLFKVQVRFAGKNKNKETFNCSLRCCGGTKGKVYKYLKDSDMDILFVVCQNLDFYLIPSDEIKNHNSSLTLNIDKNKIKYNSGKAKDWSKFKVN